MSQVQTKTQSSLGLVKEVERIRSGYSLRDLEQAVKRTEIPANIVRSTIGIHPRTFSRRVQSGTSLSKPESDSLHRLLRIHQIAIEALGDTHKANVWLQQPSIALEDKVAPGTLDSRFIDYQINRQKMESSPFKLSIRGSFRHRSGSDKLRNES
ncbi:MAG: hypothetical protein JO227_04295 [Acetobacteraceae bacterium]|nr:hypothetical protein [Acetobacteraceae bacterium]